MNSSRHSIQLQVCFFPFISFSFFFFSSYSPLLSFPLFSSFLLTPRFFLSLSESGSLSTLESKSRARLLVDTFGWEDAAARKIWCFAPAEENHSSVLCEQTKGVQYLNEIKDSVLAAFNWTVHEGTYRYFIIYFFKVLFLFFPFFPSKVFLLLSRCVVSDSIFVMQCFMQMQFIEVGFHFFFFLSFFLSFCSFLLVFL
jgi:hypothetical protein